MTATSEDDIHTLLLMLIYILTSRICSPVFLVPSSFSTLTVSSVFSGVIVAVNLEHVNITYCSGVETEASKRARLTHALEAGYGPLHKNTLQLHISSKFAQTDSNINIPASPNFCQVF